MKKNNEEGFVEAIEKFIEENNTIYDLNDTAEFIYYEREGLLKLLKEWDHEGRE